METASSSHPRLALVQRHSAHGMSRSVLNPEVQMLALQESDNSRHVHSTSL